jgi:hypothetical protein
MAKGKSVNQRNATIEFEGRTIFGSKAGRFSAPTLSGREC